MQMRSRQRGMGLFKMVFVFGSIALVATIGIKMFPLYANQLKVAKAVKSVASEGHVDPFTVQKGLERHWDIEDITFLDYRQVKIERSERGKVDLAYAYEARVHLFYNADLVLSFQGREPIDGAE